MGSRWCDLQNRRLAPTQVRILVLPPAPRPAQTWSPSGTGHATHRAGFRSDVAPPDALPTPTAVPVLRGRTRPRSAPPPGGGLGELVGRVGRWRGPCCAGPFPTAPRRTGLDSFLIIRLSSDYLGEVTVGRPAWMLW